jgi:hypothetical protein
VVTYTGQDQVYGLSISGYNLNYGRGDWCSCSDFGYSWNVIPFKSAEKPIELTVNNNSTFTGNDRYAVFSQDNFWIQAKHTLMSS